PGTPRRPLRPASAAPRGFAATGPWLARRGRARAAAVAGGPPRAPGSGSRSGDACGPTAATDVWGAPPRPPASGTPAGTPAPTPSSTPPPRGPGDSTP